MELSTPLLPPEPFRLKMVESIRLIDPAQREQVLQEIRFPGSTLIVSEDRRAARLLRPGR